MKTKLLRKIRKKFSWYIKSDGRPVLINLMKQNYIVIGDLFLEKEYANRFEPNVSREDKLWIILKDQILKDFGW